MAIYRGTGVTGTGGESDFAQLAQDAEASAAAAQLAETNAETAEANAELAEVNAELAATNSANSASAASTSASNAASSATAASNSASTATTQATNAANSATAAATSASNAATSATNAANSATSASTSASTATTQATNAANSATAAASSASSASTSATNAASSASTATTQATNAANSATAAAASATNASNSASAASTSATSASNSASSASTSATNAAASAAEAAATVTSKVSKSGDTMTGPLLVNANTSSDALRITQTGSGNALVVEDSANPDSTPFVIDTNGKALLGQTSSWASESLLNTSGGYNNGTFINNQYAYNYVFTKSRSTTPSVKTIVQNADALGSLYWRGDDGVGYIDAAAITAFVDGTPGTNDMPGRLVFSTTADGASSPTERMRISNAGRFGYNTSDLTVVNFRYAGSVSGSVSSYMHYSEPTIQSGVTTSSANYLSIPSTQAASFTLANLRHFMSAQGTIGAGSTVTNQYGFNADSSLTGATKNYGVYVGNIGGAAATTGKEMYGVRSDVAVPSGGGLAYNFYAAGSADNYFAGPVKLNTSNGNNPLTILATSSNATIDLQQNSTNNAAIIRFINNAFSSTVSSINSSASDLFFSTNGSERMRLDSSGNLISTAPTTAPTLSTNGTMVFNLTSNTNLRVSVRGSDGVTRTANITLA